MRIRHFKSELVALLAIATPVLATSTTCFCSTRQSTCDHWVSPVQAPQCAKPHHSADQRFFAASNLQAIGKNNWEPTGQTGACRYQIGFLDPQGNCIIDDEEDDVYSSQVETTRPAGQDCTYSCPVE